MIHVKTKASDSELGPKRTVLRWGERGRKEEGREDGTGGRNPEIWEKTRR